MLLDTEIDTRDSGMWRLQTLKGRAKLQTPTLETALSELNDTGTGNSSSTSGSTSASTSNTSISSRSLVEVARVVVDVYRAFAVIMAVDVGAVPVDVDVAVAVVAVVIAGVVVVVVGGGGAAAAAAAAAVRRGCCVPDRCSRAYWAKQGSWLNYSRPRVSCDDHKQRLMSLTV